jgi:hypothetical protein
MRTRWYPNPRFNDPENPQRAVHYQLRWAHDMNSAETAATPHFELWGKIEEPVSVGPGIIRHAETEEPLLAFGVPVTFSLEEFSVRSSGIVDLRSTPRGSHVMPSNPVSSAFKIFTELDTCLEIFETR